MQMDKKEIGKQENKDFVDTFWHREKVYNLIIGVSTYWQIFEIGMRFKVYLRLDIKNQLLKK